MHGTSNRSWPDHSANFLWQGSRLKHYWPLPVTVFAINSKGVLTGSEAGENQTFWYVNSFHTGLRDIDDTLLVDFDELQKLCWMDGHDVKPPRTNEIRVKLIKNADLETARTEIANLWQQFMAQKEKTGQDALLKDVIVQTWKQYRRDFIAPLENEKTLMIIVFSMIALVVVFIIFAIFYMMVTEKVKDLGILKSLGSSKWSLAEVFLGFGALVGIVGALLGTALGCAIVINSNEIEGWLNHYFGFRLWNPEIIPFQGIPNVVNYTEAMVIAAVAVLACLAGAAMPARRAAKLEVVESLRVE